MFVVESCISTIGEDLPLFGFLITAIIPNVIIKATSDMALFNLRSLLFNFAWYCVVVALSYNYKKKRTRIIYFSIITFIMYTLTYSNLMYYRFYESFLSLSLIKQIALFSDVADATTVGMSLFDILFWGLFGLSITLIIVLARVKYNKFNYEDVNTRIFNRLNFFRLALITFVVGVLTLAPGNYSQAEKLWNRPIVVEDFGLYNYHVIDIFKSVGVFIDHKPSESEYLDFLTYFKNKNNTTLTNSYTDILKGQNVIIVHAESLENFLINQTVPDVEGNEVEITPFFNQLVAEGLYFSNFYTQQSIGTSADSEFVFNSSLLPVNDTVYLYHFDTTYITTQTLLQDEEYLTMYMHGNNGSFWNRDIMSSVMGYDVFFDKNEYHATDNQVVGLGIGDYDFFQQSVDIISEATTPYLATLITLTNHTPWLDVDKYITKDELGVEEPAIDCKAINLEDEDTEKQTATCRYLQASRYADWSFGKFWESLEKQGLLENTTIVVYGDHPAKLPINEMEAFYENDMTRVEYKAKQQVPFIIWNKNIPHREIKNVMGQIDVGPTLQNMLGIKNYFALGNDIFSIEDNIVPFVNGDWTDGTIYYSFREKDYYIKDPNYSVEMIEEMIDNQDYLTEQNDRAEVIINMSNMINKFDLIGYYEAKMLVVQNKKGYGGYNDLLKNHN